VFNGAFEADSIDVRRWITTPSLSFQNRTNTGFYMEPSAGTMSLAVWTQNHALLSSKHLPG
jgi:hypothetical protein